MNMNKLITFAAVAASAAIPMTAFAAATTAPSALYDLTTSDAGEAVSWSSHYQVNYSEGFMAFDGKSATHNDRWCTAVNQTSGYVVYKFNVATVVDSIGIILPSAGNLSEAERAPKDWTFEAWNDNSAVTNVLDTQTDETGWSAGEKRYYKFANTKAYQYYKFNCTANNGADRLQIGEFEFYCVGTGNSTWTGGGETSLVNDDVNWGGAAMPGSECEAYIDDTGETPATIPGGLTVYKLLKVGRGSGKSAKVVQTTGTLSIRNSSSFGCAGGTAEYAISGGKLSVGGNCFLSRDTGGKSTSIFDISGDGEVAVGGANGLYVAATDVPAGSTARVNISENGKLSVAKIIYLGVHTTSITGMVHQTGGTVSAGTDLVVGNNSYGEYYMSGGKCTANNVSLGYAKSSSRGLFEMTGGTLSATAMLSIGRYGRGTFAAGGDGTVVTAATVRVGFKSGNNIGHGTLIVTNGAKVVTKQIFAGAGTSYPETAKVVFDGAVLTATASSTSSVRFLQDLCDITLGAGGLTINTEGYNVTIANCTFNITPGAKITVTGGGTVTFEGTTVNLTERPTRAFTFAETDGAFSGLPTLSGARGTKLAGDAGRITIVPTGLMIIVK